MEYVVLRAGHKPAPTISSAIVGAALRRVFKDVHTSFNPPSHPNYSTNASHSKEADNSARHREPPFPLVASVVLHVEP